MLRFTTIPDAHYAPPAQSSEPTKKADNRYSHLSTAFAKEVYQKSRLKKPKEITKSNKSATSLPELLISLIQNSISDPGKGVAQAIELLSLHKYDSTLFESKYCTLTLKKKTRAHYTTQVNNFNSDPVKLENQITSLNTNSYLLRIFSFAAGVFYGLNLPDFPVINLPFDNRCKIEESICKLLIAEIANTNAKTPELKKSLKIFLTETAKIISSNTGLTLKKAKNRIKDIERYYLIAKNQGKILINETVIDKATFIQMDIPLGNLLTEALKKEYNRIHDVGSEPLWFKELDSYVKHLLLKLVPKSLADNWDNFERLNYTSAMQNWPGFKNARLNYLFKNDNSTLKLCSRSVRMATLVPIEIADKTERSRITKLNAELFLDTLCELARQGFKEHWGIDAKAHGIKPLIFIHSLLSNINIKLPVTEIELADAKMVKMQTAAIEYQLKLHAKGKYADFTFIVANDATNILRKACIVSDKISGVDNSDYIEELIEYAASVLRSFKNHSFDEERGRYCHNIILAISALKRLMKATEIADRNKASAISALVKLLVYYLGAIHSTNCKSGKDRTQFDELALHTLLIILILYDYLAEYSDPEEQRQQYIDIYIILFNSMKIFEAASTNTEGAFGLKDSAKVLCADIAAKLNAMYGAANQRADMNKPADTSLERLKDKVMSAITTNAGNRNNFFNQEKVDNLNFKYDDDILKAYKDLRTDNAEHFGDKSIFSALKTAMLYYSETLAQSNSPSEKLAALKLIQEQLAKPVLSKNNQVITNAYGGLKGYAEFYAVFDRAIKLQEKIIRRLEVKPVNLTTMNLT